MAKILTGGTIVTALETYQADIRFENGKINAIGFFPAQAGDERIAVDGCYLFPGGIDPHTHLDLAVGATRTADDFFTGTKAAAVGGTTTILDFATQDKGKSLQEAIQVWHQKANGKSFIDYGFHLAVCDLTTSVKVELASIAASEGVTSVKLYLAYKNTMQVDDAALLEVLEISKKAGFLVCVHCENGDLIDSFVKKAQAKGQTEPKYHAKTRPVFVEKEATARAIALAEFAGSPLYVVHVSSHAALQEIVAAKSHGLAIYGETCPQYLLLDESAYEQPGFFAAKYVMSPPLRQKNNQDFLWNGLKHSLLATVGSDHCSFNFAGQKELGRQDFSQIPNGGPGIENRFGLLYTYGVVAGHLTLNQFVAVTSTNAAKLFGLFPQKGTIAVGSDADIVVWDPAVRSIITADKQQQNVDYNLYEGFRQKGAPRYVFLRGQKIVADGIAVEEPQGKYIKRQRTR
ncbi:dihydropyrimidinase [Propionispira raffinosivorans]|uniref:dihydropyrimidinase n=1 Tax=Propionispira raffinosivorans TaxID=86959 RepID=UPI00037C648E|nr:dihydropyrimidinase [Propionispira raffinosivorans]